MSQAGCKQLIESNPVPGCCLALIAVAALSATGVPLARSADVELPEVQCLRAAGPIQIDGRADEDAWRAAPVLDRFVTPATGKGSRPGRTATRARLLWDDDNIYFYAEMDDADLFANVTEPDGAAWTNDVFELFFKPSDQALGYYELEVNAANTHMEMYMPSRGSGGYLRWARKHRFEWQTAVVLRGTLNQSDDRDQGWSVEWRIPWSDFKYTGGRPQAGDRWRFALCRYDYSLRFVGAAGNK